LIPAFHDRHITEAILIAVYHSQSPHGPYSVYTLPPRQHFQITSGALLFQDVLNANITARLIINAFHPVTTGLGTFHTRFFPIVEINHHTRTKPEQESKAKQTHCDSYKVIHTLSFPKGAGCSISEASTPHNLHIYCCSEEAHILFSYFLFKQNLLM
jgi:hypothetical protein